MTELLLRLKFNGVRAQSRITAFIYTPMNRKLLYLLCCIGISIRFSVRHFFRLKDNIILSSRGTLHSFFNKFYDTILRMADVACAYVFKQESVYRT